MKAAEITTCNLEVLQNRREISQIINDDKLLIVLFVIYFTVFLISSNDDRNFAKNKQFGTRAGLTFPCDVGLVAAGKVAVAAEPVATLLPHPGQNLRLQQLLRRDYKNSFLSYFCWLNRTI